MIKMTAMDEILSKSCPMDTGPVPWGPEVRVSHLEAHCAEFLVYSELVSTYGGFFYTVHAIVEV